MLHRLRAGVVITAGIFALLLMPLAQGQGGRSAGGDGSVVGQEPVAGPARGFVDRAMTLDEKIQLLHGSQGGRASARRSR